MQALQGVSFGSYHLAGPGGPLLRKSLLVNLPPKALAILWVLLSRAGQVVSKEDLFTTVWPEIVVGEETLTSFIHLLRRALKDDARQPRYIATVHRQGYRFIGQGVRSEESEVRREESQHGAKSKEQGAKLNSPSPALTRQPLAPGFVGREAELMQLHALFAKALTGERQVVFVTGEAGIGKTALVETFLGGFRNWELGSGSSPLQSPKLRAQSPEPGVWMGWGQCIEQYGAGEAYLPVLEALGRWGRGPQKMPLLSVLQQYAPTWLAQLSALLSPAELEAVQRRIQGATRERMLREITEAVEVLSAESPLVLVFEDLHWSDPSTVGLLAMLARRRETARLLVLGTYRPVDLVIANHPLKAVKQELVARGQGTEVLLGGLNRDAVRTYVTQRLGTMAAPDEIARFIHKRTEGQPLFMVQVTSYLVQNGGLAAPSVTDITAVEQTLPHGLRELIEAQLERLSEDEQSVLTVGSVEGVEFTVASVAAGMEKKEPAIEELCDRLARRGQFIEARGVKTWPDGTVSGSYGFRHALYQEVLYQRLSASRRVRLHLQVGLREEAGYGERTHEIAAELAVHFERGQDKDRAALYLQKAGENLLRRYAYLEALGHFQKGTEFLQTLPQTMDRARRELALQLLLIRVVTAVKGIPRPRLSTPISPHEHSVSGWVMPDNSSASSWVSLASIKGMGNPGKLAK